MHPRKPVFWYSPDEGASGSPDAEIKSPHAEGNGGPDQKTLDKQFAERARRAEEAERKRILETAGVKDEAELQAMVKAKAEADEAAKSELQKAADKAAQAEQALEALKAENAGKLDELKRQLLDTDIKFAALMAARDRDGKVVRPPFRPEAVTEVLLLVNRSEITSENGESFAWRRCPHRAVAGP